MNTTPFYYQRVTEDQELNQFMANYRMVAGNELPIDYLANAIVYQFYRGPRAVAGFILNTVEMNPLRYMNYLDKNIQEQLLFDEDIRLEDCLEITGNYKLRQELSVAESRVYYTIMLNQAFHHAKQLKKILLVGGSVIKAVKVIQQELMNRVIYHGPIKAELLSKVKNMNPLLKIYVVEISKLPLRAVFVILNRYFLAGLKNRVKQILNNWRKKIKLSSPHPDQRFLPGKSVVRHRTK